MINVSVQILSLVSPVNLRRQTADFCLIIHEVRLFSKVIYRAEGHKCSKMHMWVTNELNKKGVNVNRQTCS